MTTIASYPRAASLDGTELVAAWKDGRQVAIPAVILGSGGTDVTLALLSALIALLPDTSNGDPVPAHGLYLNAGVVCFA